MSQQTSREEILLEAAVGLATPQERAAFLDCECGGDAALRTAVESLLRANDEAEAGFLLAPAAEAAAGDRASVAVSGPAAGPPAPSANYVIGPEIAHGGMGSILAAEDRKLGRKVAMKVMRADGAAGEDARARFVREAEVLARLDHPNIIPIYELGWNAENRPFYTMKLVQGRTLQAILDGLKQGDLEMAAQYTLDRLLMVFRKICDALALAHARGVIHRDLKPANVMVGEFGEVLVMDWGIAKVLDGAAARAALEAAAPPPDSAERFRALARGRSAAGGETLDGMVIGTPHYMAPEQAGGRVSEIDAQSDVFSLGAILYALLTLHPPAEGATSAEIIAKIKGGEIRPPTDYNLGSSRDRRGVVNGLPATAKPQPLRHCPKGRVPVALSAVTMRALALDKGSRYPTVTALAAEIEAYQGGFATSAEDAGTFKQLRLLIRRHRQGFAVGAAAWLIIIVLAVWFVLNLRASEHQAQMDQEAERRALARSQIALADAAFRNTDLPGMLQALNACPEDLRDQSWHYLHAKRDGSLRALQIPGWEKATDVLAVPGQPGQFLLCRDSENLGVIEAGADKLLRMIATGYSGRKKLAFSGDGRVLAVAPWPGHEVRVFDAAGGNLIKTISVPDIEPNSLALSQDGSVLAVTPIKSSDVDRPSLVLETSSGRILWSTPRQLLKVVFARDGRRLLAAAFRPERELISFDTSDGRELARVPAYAYTLALSPDGAALAVGTGDGEVLIVDPQNAIVRQRARLFSSMVLALAWTDGGLLLTEGGTGRRDEQRRVFRLWDPGAWKTGAPAPMATLFGLPDEYQAFWSLDPNRGELITVGPTNRLWRIPVGREWSKQSHESEKGSNCVFVDDATLLGRKAWGLARYHVSDDGKMTEIPGDPDLFGYSAGAVCPSTGRFALGGRYKEPPYDIRVFQPRPGHVDLVFTRPVESPVRGLDLDCSGGRMTSVLENGLFEVVEIASGRVHLNPPGRFQFAAFAGAEHDLVAVRRQLRTAESVEDHLVLIDGVTGDIRRSLTNYFAISAFAVSPDRKLVAIGGSDQSVHLFDAATLAPITSFRAHDGDVSALAFHPSAPVIATGGFDRTAKLWNYTRAQLLDEFMGLGGTPVALAFNPAGRLLAVDGEEHTSRVFKLDMTASMGRGIVGE